MHLLAGAGDRTCKKIRLFAFAHDYGEDVAVLLVEMYRQIEFRALGVSLGFSLTPCYPEDFHRLGSFAL